MLPNLTHGTRRYSTKVALALMLPEYQTGLVGKVVRLVKRVFLLIF